MTSTSDPTNITIIGTGDYAMAFDGQEHIITGDTDDVREAVLDRLGVNIEWCPMNEAICGTRKEPVDHSTLDKAMALIPAAEAFEAARNAERDAAEARKVAEKAAQIAEAASVRAQDALAAANANAARLADQANAAAALAARKAAAVK